MCSLEHKLTHFYNVYSKKCMYTFKHLSFNNPVSENKKLVIVYIHSVTCRKIFFDVDSLKLLKITG